MRVLVVMSSYNEEDFIDKNISSLYKYVDKIAVSTTNHITGEDSTDRTLELLSEYRKTDQLAKVLVRKRTGAEDMYNSYDLTEGFIKTELMNMMEPENGDWIWVVDADEFYSEHHLEMLRSRYILNHEALQYDKHCIQVQAMVYAYNFGHFYWARHGRFFRYKKGSYFSSVNHFTWPNGETVYSNKYNWDLSPMYMYMSHCRYIRGTVKRLRDRYIYRQDEAGKRKLKWFDEVFMQYPKNKEKALDANEKICGKRSFDSAMSGDLKYIMDPLLPKELYNCRYELNLWGEIENESSNTE